MKHMKPFPILLTQDLIDALDELKERDGIPKNEAIRRALRLYLDGQGVYPNQAITKRKPKEE